MEAILDERKIGNVIKGIEVEEEPVIISEALDDVLNKYKVCAKKVKTARARRCLPPSCPSYQV